MDFVPAEKGVPIRQPATANLMIDSADRVNLNNAPYYSALFQITKNQSILNGFFTRIGTTEVVLEWYSPNIDSRYGNNQVVIDLSGGAPGGGTVTNATYTIPARFATAEEAYDLLVGYLNTAGSTLTPAVTWTAAAAPNGGVLLTPSADVYVAVTSTLGQLLYMPQTLTLVTAANGFTITIAPDLRPTRYLDFVSAQLTYNQDLKDGSTALANRDVLCRWYFAFDQPTTYDGYGFPILMGYAPFVLRRLFNPPKQIRWDPKQPVGNIGFEVYTDQGTLLQPNYTTNWLMTLQVSET